MPPAPAARTAPPRASGGGGGGGGGGCGGERGRGGCRGEHRADGAHLGGDGGRQPAVGVGGVPGLGDVRDQLTGRRAVRGVLGQAGGDQGAQVGGEFAEVGLGVDDPEQHGRPGALTEQVPAEGGVGEGRAEREDVAGGFERLAERLLGGHVGGGADHRSGGGQAAAVGGPGDAEVDDVRAVEGEQHVAGLEVAVDQPGPVHLAERLGQTGGQRPDRRRGQRAVPVDGLPQRQARHERGGHPRDGRLAVRVHHRRGERPGDPPGRGHLVPEPLPEVLVLGQLRPHHLHRDGPPAGRPPQVHRPHATGPEPSRQRVRPDLSRVAPVEWLHPAAPLFRLPRCKATLWRRGRTPAGDHTESPRSPRLPRTLRGRPGAAGAVPGGPVGRAGVGGTLGGWNLLSPRAASRPAS